MWVNGSSNHFAWTFCKSLTIQILCENLSKRLKLRKVRWFRKTERLVETLELICRNLFQVLYSKLNCEHNHLLQRRTYRHTQNKLISRFYICIFFPYNDTVVDAQIFKIFEHDQSILDVFLNQHPLICSSPARILLCKFLKNISNTQKCFHFEEKTTMTLVFVQFLFFNSIVPLGSAIWSNDWTYFKFIYDWFHLCWFYLLQKLLGIHNLRFDLILQKYRRNQTFWNHKCRLFPRFNV